MIPEKFEEVYLSDIVQSGFSNCVEGRVEWECPSNIALIKYWGKKINQNPLNPSISFTLKKSVTKLSIAYSVYSEYSFYLDYLFEGASNDNFRNRLARYLQSLVPYFPFLKNCRLKIETSNTFPHSAGIASSASFYGAVALALCNMEIQLSGKEFVDSAIFRKASYIARLGSGSASRSVYGGFVLWGETGEYTGSSDEVAIPVAQEINPVFSDMRDSILIVSSEVKSISSSKGHELMSNHSFATARITQANENLPLLMNALKTGDLYKFVDVIENEALTLHALMMTSSPGYILLRPETVKIIEKIRNFRIETGMPVGFSLDAGPNVHVIYPVTIESQIHKFIDDELKCHCENNRVIHDHVGEGPNNSFKL